METIAEYIFNTAKSSYTLDTIEFTLIFLFLNFGLRHLQLKISKKLSSWAMETETIWDDVFAAALESTSSFFIAIFSFLISIQTFPLESWLRNYSQNGVIVVLLIQLGFWLQNGLREWRNIRQNIAISNHENDVATQLSLITFTASFFIWSTLFLLALSNIGFDVTALLASLGIGGIALALAVQNVLTDVFASFSITVDKPFLVGDFIVIDDLRGTVKQVGLKSTRLLSVTGEELIISNSELLRCRIRNYKRMKERRVIFNFGIRKDTDPKLLREISKIVFDVINKQPMTRFDFAHFKTIGSESLDFESAYYIECPENKTFLEIQHQINMAIVDTLHSTGVRLSMPSDR